MTRRPKAHLLDVHRRRSPTGIGVEVDVLTRIVVKGEPDRYAIRHRTTTTLYTHRGAALDAWAALLLGDFDAHHH